MNLKLSIVNYQLSIFVAIVTFFALPLKAQVTIGAQKAPHSYSVLELMSTKGGLRLPMLNTSERDALKLTPDSTEASGLVIYNTDINSVEFWSKDKWVALRDNSSFLSPISGNNGVTKGATGLIYSVIPVSDLATYTWTVPTDWSITSGENTNSITVTAGTTEGPAGSITVTVNNGNYTETSTLVVSVGCPVKTVGGGWLTFMCYNLGAEDAVKSLTPDQQANYSTPADEYGGYYQWGRVADGHQLSNPDVITGPITTFDAIGQAVGDTIGKFIVSGTSDWRSPQNNNLWSNDGKGVADPCPDGWRVPTNYEWIAITNGDGIAFYTPGSSYTCTSGNKWVWNNTPTRGWLITPANSSIPTLFLPASGRRDGTASFSNVANYGFYWSSATSGLGCDCFSFGNFTSITPSSSYGRTNGMSIRCVAE